ncbi:MAG: VTT domain-containing protein [Patescibacteria group bacterium]|nr:VTT domain-containing protein [Patescibacteria group bacterium]
MEIFHTETLIAIIKAAGYIGLFGIIFAESGILLGFFLPGDSLLFTAGFLASQGFLNLPILIIATAVAAITGDSVGYLFGLKVGRKLFKRKNSRFFHKENLIKAEKFYKKHGAKTIVLARFMPFVRTFAPIVAGVSKMHYKTFVSYNIIGGMLWTLTLPTLGFYLGRSIPDVDKYLLPIIFLIVFVSASPIIINFIKQKIKPKK